MSISSLVKTYPLLLLIAPSMSAVLFFGSFHILLKVVSAAALTWAFRVAKGWLRLGVIVFFVVSGLRYLGRMALYVPDPPRGKIVLEGRVEGFPQRTFSGIQIFTATFPGLKGRVLFRWKYPTRHLWGGERIRVRARIRLPRGLKNPGGFDYISYLKRKGIFYTSWIRGGDLEVVGGPRGFLWRLRRKLWGMSKYIKDPRKKGIYLSLILGERKMLPPGFAGKVRNLGLSHIFAISGLHLVLVFYLFMRLFMSLLSRWRKLLELGFSMSWSSALALIPTTVYACISGLSVPTKRALIGVFIYTILFLLKKRRKVFHAVLGAMALQLLFFPWDVGSMSFVLSFSAVFSILFALKLYGERGMGSRLVLFLMVTLSPFLFTLPLQVVFFHRVPLFAPIANVVVLPMVGGFTMPVLIVSSLGFLLVPSHIFPRLAEIAVLPLLLADRAPRALRTAIPVIRFDVFAFVSLVFLFVFLFLRGRLKKVALGFSAVLFVFWVILMARVPRDVEIYILDVGMGNAVLVKGPSGSAVIDFGPSTLSGRAISDLACYLNIRRVDVAILTSDKRGCSGGLGAFLRVSKPRKFYFCHLPLDRDVVMSYQGGKTRFFKVERQLVLREVGIPIRVIPAGSELSVVVCTPVPFVISGKTVLKSLCIHGFEGPSIIKVSRGNFRGIPKRVILRLRPALLVAPHGSSSLSDTVLFTTDCFGCIKVLLGERKVVVSSLEP